jgi:hypothetical protein
MKHNPDVINICIPFLTYNTMITIHTVLIIFKFKFYEPLGGKQKKINSSLLRQLAIITHLNGLKLSF